MAREADVTEVILLDPTLNQRKDFDVSLRLLARENPDQRFTYFGELRAEGIKPETASCFARRTLLKLKLVAVGRSCNAGVDGSTQQHEGIRARCIGFDGGGIRVESRLIIGLPGDTLASVRRGFDYLASSKLFTSAQVFQFGYSGRGRRFAAKRSN